jgi:polysaccharide biosynthesis transport protein
MPDQPSPPRYPLALATANPLARCDARLVTLLQPCSWEAEQFRCLRYSLLRVLGDRECSVIAVSGPCNGNGTTTTAINLAVSLDEGDSFRVLLVDADLRTAAIADRLALGTVTDDGLDTALVNWSIELRDIVRRFPGTFALDVLPTAARPEIAGSLVASPRFGMLLAEARERYDFIIIDTPPLLPAADCRVMMQWVDGFVVVVAAHRTPRKILEEALNVMSQEQILGLVYSGDDGSPWFPHNGYDVWT